MFENAWHRCSSLSPRVSSVYCEDTCSQGIFARIPVDVFRLLCHLPEEGLGASDPLERFQNGEEGIRSGGKSPEPTFKMASDFNWNFSMEDAPMDNKPLKSCCLDS
jgi:hypothetical protein